MCVGWPCLWLAIAAATSTKTRIGATAFSAAMKRSPSSATDLVAPGAISASAMPRTRPMAIWEMRLMRITRCRAVGFAVVIECLLVDDVVVREAG
jgi:hypothetical protein